MNEILSLNSHRVHSIDDCLWKWSSSSSKVSIKRRILIYIFFLSLVVSSCCDLLSLQWLSYIVRRLCPSSSSAEQWSVYYSCSSSSTSLAWGSEWSALTMTSHSTPNFRKHRISITTKFFFFFFSRCRIIRIEYLSFNRCWVFMVVKPQKVIIHAGWSHNLVKLSIGIVRNSSFSL